MMKRLHVLSAVFISIHVLQGGPPREEKGVEYQQPPLRQYLDVTLPGGAGPFAAVIVLHGGGFQGGGRADVAELSKRVAAAGMVAVAVDYRMPPQLLFPAQLNDVKSSIRWVRANAQRLSVDPRRIGVMGMDAGGYLAVFAALTGGAAEFEGIGPHREQTSRVQCAAAIHPLLSLQALDVHLRETLLGGAANAANSERRSDPLNWISPDAAPVLLIGSKGTAADEFTARMSRAGVESTLAAPRATAREDEDRAISFLSSHLANEPQTRIVVADHGPAGEVVLMDWPSGREVWRAPNLRGHDAQALPSGNILVTLDEDGSVVEYDPRQPAGGNIAWTYGPAEGLKLTISAERLANGNTLIADTGLGKLIEVTTEGRKVWEYANPDLAGNRMRHCRLTASGTVLISVEAAGKIIEVDRSGKIVWSWTAQGGGIRRPYQGLRLANGNTMVGLTSPGEIVEVEPGGKVVRSIAGANGKLRIGWASSLALLPNGNLLVGDYTGQRLIEIDDSGGAVHELLMERRPATVAIAAGVMP
jgi:alpha/beta hydrolase fold/PQQ-like domain